MNRQHKSPIRKEANRSTRTRTRMRAYHIEADDPQCSSGDFDDYEEWMIGPLPNETPVG